MVWEYSVRACDFASTGKLVTKRLVQYIISLCSQLTIKEIVQHLNLDWKTAKAIQKGISKLSYHKQ